MKQGYILTSFVMCLLFTTSMPHALAAENGKNSTENNIKQTSETNQNEALPKNDNTSATPVSDTSSNTTSSTRIAPDAALQRLMEGNKRFMHDKTICPERNQERRLATLEKQKPFAIVVGCSDSRIPPEFAFDQGIGDMFVVRIAGNVVSKLEIDSVEYSVLHNDSSIIMVLGHQNCGAVTAVMQNDTKDIESIAELIKPALYNANHQKMTLEQAIVTNVKNSVERIKRSRVISKLIKEGKISVVGAYYSLETGEAKLVTND